MRVLVKKFLDYNLSEDNEWRILAEAQPKVHFPAPSTERVKHVLIEMYEATKQVCGVGDESVDVRLERLILEVCELSKQ